MSNEVVRVLANGTPVDSRGRFLPGAQPTTAIAKGDSARGRELAARLREKCAASARLALAERAEAEGLQRSPAAAYGLLAGEAYDSARANIMDKPREGVEAGKFALRLGQLLPTEDKTQNVQAVQIVLAPEAASYARSLLEAEEQAG